MGHLVLEVKLNNINTFLEGTPNWGEIRIDNNTIKIQTGWKAKRIFKYKLHLSNSKVQRKLENGSKSV